MNCSMPGLPVHHHLPEFTRTHHPSSWWCHPAISSFVIPFSSHPQSLPASESFPMSQLFAWGGQSTGVSALALYLPKNTQGWSPSEWIGWISLQSKGLSRVFSNTTVQKQQFLFIDTLNWHKIIFVVPLLNKADSGPVYIQNAGEINSSSWWDHQSHIWK